MESKVLIVYSDRKELFDENASRVLWMHPLYKERKENILGKPFPRDIKEYLLPKFWSEKEQLISAHEYCQDVKERFLKILSLQLDNMHMTNYGVEGWRLFCGLWLESYLSSMYDKYVRLKYVKEYYQKCYILQDEAFYIEKNTYCILDARIHDQQYIDICKNLGIEVSYDIAASYKQIQSQNEKIYNKKKYKFSKSIYRKSPVLYLYENHLTINKEFLEFISKGRIRKLQFNFKEVEELQSPISFGLREGFKRKAEFDNEFENMAFDLLGKYIPMIYVECFAELQKCYIRNQIPIPKVIVDSNNNYGDMLFKLLVYDTIKNGGKLNIIQHGGNYCLDRYTCDRESEIATKLYTWGEQKIKENHYSMNICKLCKKNRRKTKKDILFVDYTWPLNPRYMKNMQVFWAYEIEQETFDFYRNLDRHIAVQFLMRSRANDDGWHRKERLLQEFPEMRFDTNSSYYKSLESTKLVITNNISTTYIEALAMNIPTIIILKEEYFLPEKTAIEILKELREVQVIISDAKDAARLVNKIGNDVEAWWNEKKRRLIVKKFLRLYGVNQGTLSKLKWYQEIIKESKA